MEISNQTYEAVGAIPHPDLYIQPDQRPESYVDPAIFKENTQGKPVRPESYVNPLAIAAEARESQSTSAEYYVDPSTLNDGCECDGEENYETLTEIQTRFNLYEVPPVIECKKQPPPTSELTQDKEKTFESCDRDKTEINKIKEDLRKTKILLLILGLLLVLVVLLSVTAVILAVATSRNSLGSENVVLGPQARVGQGNQSGQPTAEPASANSLSARFEEVYAQMDAYRDEVNQNISELVSHAWQNLSEVAVKVKNVSDGLSSDINQLQQQLSSLELNFSSLRNEHVHTEGQLNTLKDRLEKQEERVTNFSLTQMMLLDQFRSNLSRFHQRVENLQENVHSTHTDVGMLRGRVTQVENRTANITDGVNTANQQIGQIQYQLNTTRSDVAAVNSRLTSVQTSINNRLNSPVNLYQNCRHDSTSCNYFRAINDNRRLFCSTPSTPANITVSSKHAHECMRVQEN